jgi:hypothetical protein
MSLGLLLVFSTVSVVLHRKERGTRLASLDLYGQTSMEEQLKGCVQKPR